MRNRKTNILAALFAALLAIAASLVCSRRSVAYDRHICTECGLKRTEYTRQIGPITCRNEISLQQSVLSQGLKITNCPHSWLLYSFGHSSRAYFGRAGFAADGGTRS